MTKTRITMHTIIILMSSYIQMMTLSMHKILVTTRHHFFLIRCAYSLQRTRHWDCFCLRVTVHLTYMRFTRSLRFVVLCVSTSLVLACTTEHQKIDGLRRLEHAYSCGRREWRLLTNKRAIDSPVSIPCLLGPHHLCISCIQIINVVKKRGTKQRNIRFWPFTSDIILVPSTII